MTFSFSILTLLLFLGFGQAVTISGILIVRFFRKQRGDFLFSILFFLTLYIYLTDLLVPTGIYRIVPFLLFTDFPVLFLLPPVLLLYVKKMTGNAEASKIKSLYLLHFAPFLTILIAHFPRFFLDSSQKILMFQVGTIPPPLLFGINMFFLGLTQFLLYLLYCFYLLYKKNNNGNPRQTKRLRNILFFYLVVFICFTVLLLHHKNYPQRDFSYLRLMLDFPIFIICIYNYYILVSGNQSSFNVNKSERKYRKSGLMPRENRKICADLCAVLEEEKLWADPDLDLRTLAEKTGHTYHVLSQAINQTTGLNYHGFINRYRIAEACRLLQDTDMNVLDIAFAAGFNSKPTFNTVFKKEKDCTPTQYRKANREKTF